MTPATRQSYDRVAARYLEHFQDELEKKPFDRAFLDAVAGSVVAMSGGRGWTVDLGCGPGQIGRYLAGRGLPVIGVDLSFEMVRRARGLLGPHQIQADMRVLPFADGSIEGVVAFYSVIHLPAAPLETAIHEIARVLASGGHLAVTSHVAPPGDGADRRRSAGDGVLHVDELLSEPVDLSFYFYRGDHLSRLLEDAGLEVLRCDERGPYPPAVEAQTRRAYLLARKLARSA